MKERYLWIGLLAIMILLIGGLYFYDWYSTRDYIKIGTFSADNFPEKITIDMSGLCHDFSSVQENCTIADENGTILEDVSCVKTGTKLQIKCGVLE